MARLLDTIPEFDRFARKAGLQSPVVREQLWKEQYESAHRAVFDVFYERYPAGDGMRPLIRDLSTVAKRVREAAKTLPGLIEEVEPAVGEVLGVRDEPEPLHVLMVGTFATNAFVATLGDDIALFHCLEWFTDPGPARVLIAHEDTHAWHRAMVGAGPEDDLAWTAFVEGLAVQASRRAVPDRPEEEYFWYGVRGFEDWLPWCRERRGHLLGLFREALDRSGAVEEFFGAGFVEEHWRVGQFVADDVVGRMGRDLSDLARLDAEEARTAVRAVLSR